jgi:methionine-rich copper-binding protein CopC
VPLPTPIRSGKTVRRLVGALAAVAAVGVAAPTADAHTDLEYTVPAADEQVSEPVTTITIAFSDPVTVVGEGFAVFTPDEEQIQPGFFTDDDMVYVLTLAEPVSGGVVGVRYEVVAADGHVLSDAFTFTVADVAPAPTVGSTASPAPATPAPATPAPGAADGGGVGSDGDDGSSTGIVVGIGVAVVVAAAAAVVLRSRLGARAT